MAVGAIGTDQVLVATLRWTIVRGHARSYELGTKMKLTPAQANTPIDVTLRVGGRSSNIELCDPTSITNFRYGPDENAIRTEAAKLGDLSGVGAVTKDVGDILEIRTADFRQHHFPLQAGKVPDPVRAIAELLGRRI